jgi:hypothetical protein
MMWGAVAFWVLALAAHFAVVLFRPCGTRSDDCGYLVPGYLLRKRGSHDTVQGA